MTTHMRQQIVEKVEEILTDALPTGTLSTSKTPIKWDGTLKVVVMALDENDESISENVNQPRYYDRELELLIVLGLANTHQTDRFSLDTWCKTIEEAMGADVTFDRLVFDSRLVAYRFDFEDGVERPEHVTLSYVVEYTTLATDVSVHAD